jgi:hypothetical protein
MPIHAKEEIDATRIYAVMGEYLIGLKNLEKRLYMADLNRMNADDTRGWASYIS